MVAADIATVLASAGLGVGGTTILAGRAATIPGAGPCISIVETSGVGSVMSHDARRLIRRPSAQIACRAATPEAARALAEAAHRACADIVNTTIGTRFYLSLAPRQEPYELEPDAHGRARLVFNVQARFQEAG